MIFFTRAGFFLATTGAAIVVVGVLSGCGRAHQSNQTASVTPQPPAPTAASTPAVVVEPSAIPPPPAPPSLLSPTMKGQQASKKTGDYQELNDGHPGDPVDINASLVAGKRTIVEFYSPYCGPCMALRPYVQRLALVRPDLAVRSINVNRPEVVGIDWRSPVIRQNRQIRFLPYFMIYGTDKRLEAHGPRASNAVVECIEQTFRKPSK